MNGFETIIFEKNQGIGYIILNRPRVLNAYNIKMRDEMWQVLGAVGDDPEVQVVILKGAGEKAFSVGADLTEFGTAPSPVIARQVRWQRDVWGRFLGVEKPMIAAIHGYCIGSGVEMALCCDIRIASDDAQFGLPETALGMIPAAGATQTVPRMVGVGNALELLLCVDRIDAAEALRIGLINRVVSRQELYPSADELAQKIMSQAPLAVKYAKEAVNRGIELPLSQGLELEDRLYTQLLSTKDAMEGVRACL